MFGKINNVRKRAKEDKGDSSIILGILLIIAILIAGGLLLDVTKARQLKTSYVDASRKATQGAIMYQSTEGYLKPEAAGAAVQIYEQITRPAVVNPEGYFSKCSNYGDEDVVLEVFFLTEDGKKKISGGSIKRSEVHGDRREVLSRMTGVPDEGALRAGPYTSIQLNVEEGTENAILPTAFKLTQSSEEKAESMKCQKMGISSRANMFVGDKDGKYN